MTIYVTQAQAEELLLDGVHQPVYEIASRGERYWAIVGGLPPEPKHKHSPTATVCDYASSGRVASRSCEICGFSQATESAHILPAKWGYPKQKHNILVLCPNHHKLFDRFALSTSEMAKLWPRVARAYNGAIDDRNLDEIRKKLANNYNLRLLPEIITDYAEEHGSSLFDSRSRPEIRDNFPG